MTASSTLSFDDRLLAEAVRALEHDGASAIDDERAEADAREAGGALEARIAARAARLAVAPALRAALALRKRATTWIACAALIGAAFLGAAAARAALGGERDEPVNFYWVVVSLLGVQTLALVVWTLLVVLRPRAINVSLLGEGVLGAGRWVAAKLASKPSGRIAVRPSAGAEHAAAAHATGSLLARSGIGRWTLSAVSHALWLAFNGGALVTLVLLLWVRQYTFAWETTILSERTYVPLTEAIGAIPSALGFDVPDPEHIEASRWRGEGPPSAAASASSEAWSQLLVGSIVSYGVVPRATLLAMSLLSLRRAKRRVTLDLDAPGFARLAPRLMPSVERSGPIDDQERGERGVTAHAGGRSAPSSPAGSGAAAIVGLEIVRPATGWPPALDGVELRDLGFIEGRDDRRRVAHALARIDPRPRMVVVVCALSATPDRGFGSALEELGAGSGAPIALVLTGGETLRRRASPEGVAQRAGDWRSLATGAGIDPARIVEVDLDHLTAVSRGTLASLLGAAARPEARRHIEEAFGRIAAYAEAQRGRAPDTAVQAKVYAELARLYGHEREIGLTGALRGLFGRAAGASPATLGASMKSSAERFVALLPPRLRASPKWLGAGALAGALGCAAAALLVTPIAISSLPLWSALGATVAAALQPGGAKAAAVDQVGAHGPDLDESVRAMALFAMLLELQGRDEASIGRILDEAIPDEGPGAVDLDELRHGFDIALAREVGA